MGPVEAVALVIASVANVDGVDTRAIVAVAERDGKRAQRVMPLKFGPDGKVEAVAERARLRYVRSTASVRPNPLWSSHAGQQHEGKLDTVRGRLPNGLPDGAHSSMGRSAASIGSSNHGNQ